MARVVLFLVLYIVGSANGLYLEVYQHVDDGSGSPLFLTPYIESGKIEEARNLSRVDFPGILGVKSYAGFFTVDKSYDSNQYLWYFPAKRYIKEPVVMLWLQGGPGVSSLFGAFDENGPIEVKNGSFHERQTHWATEHHLIYIDNPVGTGFSFTNDSRGYCTDQTQVGEHLYTTLIQFFQLFPELQKYKFYISGESCAGKYIPALGYTIHKKNPTANVKINLTGLIIGDGLCDPVNQLVYSDYLYQIGLIDWNQKKQVEKYQDRTIELIKKEAWHGATMASHQLLSYIQNTIMNISLYNYYKLKFESDGVECDYCDLLNNSSIRKAMHVGNLTYNLKSNVVFEALYDDIMKSVSPWISELLDHYHILFYNGQLDIIVAYPLTVNFLRKLNFSGNEEYLQAERKMIVFPKESYYEVLGYVKRGGNLTEALVRNAGHMVPSDRPEWILNMIISWRLMNDVRHNTTKS